jgi:Na+/melibiose symporter-like transporter
VPDRSPEEKPLQTVSFVVHATRGVIRDHNTRRKMMFAVLLIALLLLVLGFTVLQSALNPREHPIRFLFFWVTCGWLTFTAMLLAFFDLLMVRLEARRAQRRLQQDLKPDSSDSGPSN